MSAPAKTPRPAPDLSKLPGVTVATAIEPLLRLSDLARVLAVSRRTIERERSAGRFPAPDLTIGKAPLWKPDTLRQWIERGGA